MAFNRADDEQTHSSEPKSVKRPYATPHLTVHGTVAELTQAKLIGRPLAPGYLTAG